MVLAAALVIAHAAAASAQTFSYTGPSVALPDNAPAGVQTTINVSGVSGTIVDLNFSIDGVGPCSNVAGDANNGVTHTWVGDIIVRLQSPTGTVVTLIDRPGFPAAPFGIDAENFCNTVIDDEATQTIENASAASDPFTGSWIPNNPLTAFDGEDPNGVWTMTISDNAADDLGTLHQWSLQVVAGLPGGSLVSIDDVSVPEGDAGTTTATFTVSMDIMQAADVEVPYMTVNGTATSPFDYVGDTGTVTITAGTLSNTIGIDIVGDPFTEDDETFQVVLGTPMGNATVLDGTGVGTIEDDDPPAELFFDDFEGALNWTLTNEWHIATSSACLPPLPGFNSPTNALAFSTEVGCMYANDPDDLNGFFYATLNNPVMIPANALSATLSWFDNVGAEPTFDFYAVEVSSDGGSNWDVVFINSVDERVWDQESADLSAYLGESILVRFGFDQDFSVTDVGWYIDDVLISAITPPPGFSSVSIADASATEGAVGDTDTMTFTITATPANDNMLQVDYMTSDGTAVDGTDYTGSTGFVIIPAMTDTATFTIDVLGDFELEGDETFTVTLIGVTGMGLVADGTAIGTIVDDDLAIVATFDFEADTPPNPPAGWTQVRDSDFGAGPENMFEVDTTGGATSEFLSFVGNTTQFAFVNDDRDDTEAALVTTDVAIISPVLDMAGAYFAELQFDRRFVTFGGVAHVYVRNGLDPWTLIRTYTADEPWANESIEVSSSLVGDMTQFAFGYDDNDLWAGGLGVDNIVVRQGVLPAGFSAVRIAGMTVDEGDSGTTTLTLDVTVEPPNTGEISIDFATADGTATAGSDFVATGGTLKIAAMSSGDSISVMINGDTQIEGPESFTLSLTSVTGDALLADAVAVITIREDDVPQAATFGVDITADMSTTFQLDDPSTVTTIAATPAAAFTGGDFRGSDFSTFFAWNETASQLVSINTATGVVTPVLTATPFEGATGFWLGLVWDPTTETMFATSGDPTNNVASIYSVTIGPPASVTRIAAVTGGFVGPSCLAVDPNSGTLFAIDLLTDDLITINKATGATASRGVLDFSTGAFFQDADFEDASGQLYIASFNPNTGLSELRLINTASATSLNLGVIGTATQFGAWGIQGGAPITIDASGLKVR